MPSRTPRSKLVLFGTAVVVVLALSLGLGLGLGLEHSNASTSSGSTSASTAAASSTNTSQWGDYSATFVARDQLVNPADFVLAEAWDASAPPTTREFNWTVTEVWANPGAIWKRMLVVNGAPSCPARLYRSSARKLTRFARPRAALPGQSPGPTIHANTGDRIIVRVTNGLACVRPLASVRRCSPSADPGPPDLAHAGSENSTTLHWHGLYHRGTNFYDGAQSVTQCGIPPGATFTYDFTIQQGAMSTWWHSHSGVQYADGLFGALVLHSPNETAAFVQDAANGTAAQTPAYDGEQIFLLGDLYNTFAPELYWRYMLPGTGMDGQPGDEPVPDGGHINGISQSKCAYYPATNQVIPERRRALADGDDDEDEPASFERRNPGDGNFTVYAANLTCADANATATFFNATLSAGKTYRLRLANVGTFANVQFSIDNHTLTVVEAEGTSVEPVQVQSLVLGVAQRYSVLVTLDQTPGPYWIRSELMTDMFTYDNPGVETLTLGVLRYDGTDTDAMPAQADSAPDISGVKGALDISNVGGDLVPSDVIDAPDATLCVSLPLGLLECACSLTALTNSPSPTPPPHASASGRAPCPSRCSTRPTASTGPSSTRRRTRRYRAGATRCSPCRRPSSPASRTATTAS